MKRVITLEVNNEKQFDFEYHGNINDEDLEELFDELNECINSICLYRKFTNNHDFKIKFDNRKVKTI